MAVRPSDWFLVELSADPVPGDAFGIRSLAAKYADIAATAGDAADGVHRARTSGVASEWIGDAGEVFRDKSERMPGELRKANDSYSIVAAALTAWASAVDDTQAQADRGLQQAREAHTDRLAASAALSVADSTWTTVHAQLLSYQKLQMDYASVPRPANVTMPTDFHLRSNARNASAAQAAIAAEQRHIADADARLAAARTMVLDAKTRRDDVERAIVYQIGEAQDRAVKPSSLWEAIQDSAAWQTIVQVATVALTIVSVLAIFVGGPLVWALILAATVLLVVNALLSLARGKDAWGELALLGIGVIPGGRLLGLAAKGVEAVGRMGVAGEHIAGGIGAVTTAVRGGTNVVTHVGDLVGARIAELASAVPNGILKALYAGSADSGVLTSVFQREYHQVMGVNAANFWKGVEGFDANCTRCVIATDHTIEGAASGAMPVFSDGDSPGAVAEHFGQTINDFIHQPGYDSIVQSLTDLGEGARAIVLLDRGPGMVGHVFNVIHDSNGIVFIDGQTGTFATLEKFQHLFLLITKG